MNNGNDSTVARFSNLVYRYNPVRKLFNSKYPVPPPAPAPEPELPLPPRFEDYAGALTDVTFYAEQEDVPGEPIIILEQSLNYLTNCHIMVYSEHCCIKIPLCGGMWLKVPDGMMPVNFVNNSGIDSLLMPDPLNALLDCLNFHRSEVLGLLFDSVIV